LLNTLILDKRGGEKIMSVWWIFCLTVVGVGIVVATLMYYSADEDVRSLEAEVLYNKIVNCITENGVLIQGISNPEFDLIKTCDLDEKIINEDYLFYINVGIFDINGNSLRQNGENIIEGNTDFLTQCELQEKDENGKETRAEYFAKCFKKNLEVFYEDDILIKSRIEILVASNNQGRKVVLENE